MREPYLAGIRLYPIKSLDAREVSETRIGPGGALEGDRRWALCDAEGDFVNGKREPAVHRLRAWFEDRSRTVVLAPGGAGAGEPQRFSLDGDLASIESFLKGCFARPVRLQRNDETGFPDDLKAPGPTLVGTASLTAVCAWFPPLAVPEARRRFRANLEIAGVPAFWEDRLYGPKGVVVRFRIGNVRFEGTNPSQRCVVPSRDPDTGVAIPGFQKRFAEQRRATLPAWADVSRFDHFYRFVVNTRVPVSEVGKLLRVGDPVEIEEGVGGPAPYASA